MHITVIGSGYVGTTTGLMFAELGYPVTCVDNLQEKVDQFSQGVLPFYEPGLDTVLKKHLTAGSIAFTTDIQKAVEKGEMIYIAVGTPSQTDGSTDLQYIRQVAKALGQAIKRYKVIVMKSTVPVGTTEQVRRWIKAEQQEAVAFDMASNPEFLREGSAFHDAMHPDRIVIGAQSNKAQKMMLSLFASFQCPKLLTSIRAAEMIKYAANAYLSTRISYINEIARLCDKLGVDVTEVIKGIGLDHRIGKAAIYAGIGWGGSCFPKDVSSLIHIGDAADHEMKILKSVRQVNDEQIDYFLTKVTNVLGQLAGKQVAVLGLAFKPNTDDIRESPALKLIPKLLKEKAVVRLSDPLALPRIEALMPEVRRYTDPLKALEGADAVLLVTDWVNFVHLDWQTAGQLMKQPLIFDGRNCLDPAKMAQSGFTYYGIGRGGKTKRTVVSGNV